MSKIQNSDVKSQAELVAAGATAAQLINDTKIYITANSLNKRLDEAIIAGDIGGGAGVGGVDILFAQTFESAKLADFTQTGLSLSASNPLHGGVSALLTHQPATSQSFKQVIPVDRKFRAQSMVMRLNVKSNASAGNVTLNVYDETNAANLIASEQLQLSDDVNGELSRVSFTIPETCASLSYTITALQQAGSPVTRVDDIIAELAVTALLETSVEVPVVETQTSRISQAASFGNADITGALTTSTGSGVYSYNSGTGVYTVIKNAQIDISATFRASGAASVQPLITDSAGSIEYATDTSLASAAARANASGSFYFTAGSTFKIRNALAGTTNEQYISVNAVYTSSTTKTIPLTQSGLIQEVDSYIRLYGANGYGSTATKIPRLATLDKSLGSDILYQDSATNGASFTIQRAGIYDIALSFDSSPQSQIGLSLNSSQLTTNVNAISIASRLAYGVNNTGWGSTVSHSGYFNAGDVIRPHTDGAAIAALTNFSISKQSSLKQVSVNPNSKMTLPSSELRMEGITGRGSTDTRVIQYSAISAIRGDAFTVVSNSVNGTVITITKAGKISINANAQIAAGELFISENQAVLTSNPTASETLGYSFSPSSANAQNVSFVGTVNVGDILRITSSSAPSASSGNLLTILHEETSIGVGVSNTLPQFSESDSCVRVVGANGYGSTNTSVRRFSSVDTNLGTDIVYTDSASLGGSFTVAVTGIYSISFSDTSNVSGTQSAISIQKNSTTFSQVADSATLAMDNDRYNTNAAIVRLLNASWTGTLVAGDVIRAVNDAANVNGTSAASFTISKVGKPNVTGVDVTPFVTRTEQVTQSSIMNTSITIANAVVTGALAHSNNSGLYSYNSSTGVYTIISPCTVFVSYSARKAASGLINLTINSSAKGVLGQSSPDNSTAGVYIAVSASFSGSPGETFSCRGNNGNNQDSQTITVTAVGSSPNIVTAPESFSTDTALLTYAGSAQYTLSTLANAPVGTFITFTYAATSNTRTQTTSAPTQATADMNVNGIQLFTRAYNAASTAASPAVVAIQIGKGLKGVSRNLYQSTGKVNAGSLDIEVHSATNQNGIALKDYNEQTGILMLDAGYCHVTTITTSNLLFSDLSSATSGYVVINASKNPALTGISSSVCSGRVVSSSGQTITNGTPTKITWNSSPTFAQNVTWDSANSRFIAQVAGKYQVDSSITQTRAWTSGQQTGVRIYKNGSFYSHGISGVAWAAFNGEFGQNVSDIVDLQVGDYIEIYGFMVNASGNSTLVANASYNYFSIAKVGGLG
jgi:hypothetical protein